LSIDYEAFLSAVWGDLEGNVVIARPSAPGLAPNIHDWFYYPNDLPEMVNHIEWHNDIDLYLGVSTYGEELNERGTRAKTKENTLQAAAVWSDADSFDPEGFRVEPSIIVHTSEGHTHCWWLLDEVVDADDAAHVSDLIAHAHRGEGADWTGSSAKILRIPGTTNNKYGQAQDVTVDYGGTLYSLDEIEDAYSDIDIRATTSEPGDFVDPLEEVESALDLIEQIPEHRTDIRELLYHEPPEGKRSEMRHKLLRELIELNQFTGMQVAAIAWVAKCSSKWVHDDPRGFEGMIYEVNRAHARPGTPGTTPPSVPPSPDPVVDDSIRPERVNLLSDKERNSLGTDDWVEKYLAAGYKLHGERTNEPYYRTGAILVLSSTLGDLGYFDFEGRRVNTNNYNLTIGHSTTGKSEEAELADEVIVGYWNGYYNPFIGGNASPAGLAREIIENHNGSAALYTYDEASAVFRGMKNADWRSELSEFLLSAYDGKVEKVHKVSSQDISNVDVTANLSLRFLTTPEKAFESMTIGMFNDGLLARFIITVGKPKERIRRKNRVRHEAGDAQSIKRNLWLDLEKSRKDLVGGSGFPASKLEFTFSDEALNRLDEALDSLDDRFEHEDRYEATLSPIINRLTNTAKKTALLLALYEGHREVQLRHMLLALREVEIWFGNSIWLLRMLSSSEFAADCDRLEAWIARQPKSHVRRDKVYRYQKDALPMQVEMRLTSLRSQGRIKDTNVDGVPYIAITQRGA